MKQHIARLHCMSSKKQFYTREITTGGGSVINAFTPTFGSTIVDVDVKNANIRELEIYSTSPGGSLQLYELSPSRTEMAEYYGIDGSISTSTKLRPNGKMRVSVTIAGLGRISAGTETISFDFSWNYKIYPHEKLPIRNVAEYYDTNGQLRPAVLNGGTGSTIINERVIPVSGAIIKRPAAHDYIQVESGGSVRMLITYLDETSLGGSSNGVYNSDLSIGSGGSQQIDAGELLSKSNIILKYKYTDADSDPVLVTSKFFTSYFKMNDTVATAPSSVPIASVEIGFLCGTIVPVGSEILIHATIGDVTTFKIPLVRSDHFYQLIPGFNMYTFTAGRINSRVSLFIPSEEGNPTIGDVASLAPYVIIEPENIYVDFAYSLLATRHEFTCITNKTSMRAFFVDVTKIDRLRVYRKNGNTPDPNVASVQKDPSVIDLEELDLTRLGTPTDLLQLVIDKITSFENQYCSFDVKHVSGTALTDSMVYIVAKFNEQYQTSPFNIEIQYRYPIIVGSEDFYQRKVYTYFINPGPTSGLITVYNTTDPKFVHSKFPSVESGLFDLESVCFLPDVSSSNSLGIFRFGDEITHRAAPDDVNGQVIPLTVNVSYNPIAGQDPPKPIVFQSSIVSTPTSAWQYNDDEQMIYTLPGASAGLTNGTMYKYFGSGQAHAECRCGSALVTEYGGLCDCECGGVSQYICVDSHIMFIDANAVLDYVSPGETSIWIRSPRDFGAIVEILLSKFDANGYYQIEDIGPAPYRMKRNLVSARPDLLKMTLDSLGRKVGLSEFVHPRKFEGNATYDFVAEKYDATAGQTGIDIIRITQRNVRDLAGISSGTAAPTSITTISHHYWTQDMAVVIGVDEPYDFVSTYKTVTFVGTPIKMNDLWGSGASIVEADQFVITSIAEARGTNSFEYYPTKTTADTSSATPQKHTLTLSTTSAVLVMSNDGTIDISFRAPVQAGIEIATIFIFCRHAGKRTMYRLRIMY
jgi:hypothetical protein